MTLASLQINISPWVGIRTRRLLLLQGVMQKILYFGFAEDADWLQLRARNRVRNRNRNPKKWFSSTITIRITIMKRCSSLSKFS